MTSTPTTSKDSFVGKLLRFFLLFIPGSTKVVILRGRLKGKRWIKGSGVNGYWLGTYELYKQKLFERVIRPGGVVYDIGAHAGFYSLLAAELVGESGSVFAFEPSPENAAYLKKHIAINHNTSVRVVQAAVSDFNGEAPFKRGENSFTGRISVKSGSEEIKVKVITIDDFVGKSGTPPNLMKIDTEGTEIAVLRGAKETIERHHPAIFLSTHNDTATKECLEWLKIQCYNFQEIDENEFYAQSSSEK